MAGLAAFSKRVTVFSRRSGLTPVETVNTNNPIVTLIVIEMSEHKPLEDTRFHRRAHQMVDH